MEFSTTQGSNLAVIAAAIVAIVSVVKDPSALTESNIVTIIAGIAALVAAIVSFINRYKKGDLTLGGMRK